MRRSGRDVRDERGQALAEFALVLPILLAVVTGIAELGIAFSHYLALADAVRAGARVASVSRTAADPTGTTISAVRSAGSDLPSASDPSQLQVSVTPAPTAATPWAPGQPVTVTATYPFTISIFGMTVKTGSLQSSTTARVE